MEVIPSIDLKGGLCVRLYQGDYQQETVYSQDPVAVAAEWQAQDARSSVHLPYQGDAMDKKQFENFRRVEMLQVDVHVGETRDQKLTLRIDNECCIRWRELRSIADQRDVPVLDNNGLIFSNLFLAWIDDGDINEGDGCRGGICCN